MSWLYSRALVEACLGGGYSDGALFAQSSGEPIPQAYCAPDKMTDFSRLSRFGMTCKPLTEFHGEELLTWFRAGFPVKTSASQDAEQELQGKSQACGITWRASLAKFCPDTFSWKTVQLSFLEDSELSLVIWPRSGMTANGRCWELPMLGQTIAEKESGSELKEMWPTPCAQEGSGGGSSKDAQKAIDRVKRPSGAHRTLHLRDAVMLWPTPTAHNAKETGAKSQMGRNTVQLGDMVGGQLNPTFVEWLMGWPLGWTDLKPLVTDKSHCALQQHGDCLETRND